MFRFLHWSAEKNKAHHVIFITTGGLLPSLYHEFFFSSSPPIKESCQHVIQVPFDHLFQNWTLVCMCEHTYSRPIDNLVAFVLEFSPSSTCENITLGSNNRNDEMTGNNTSQLFPKTTDWASPCSAPYSGNSGACVGKFENNWLATNSVA